LHDSMKGPLYRAKKLMAAVSRKKLLANQNYSFCPKIFGINESNHLLNQLSKFLWQRGYSIIFMPCACSTSSAIRQIDGMLTFSEIVCLISTMCWENFPNKL
jgi:hypothetical protein